MTIQATEALKTVTEYMDRYPSDSAVISEFRSHLDTYGEAFFSRANSIGHVTCSAVLLNNLKQVLMVRHNTLGKWLTPGGHVDSTDSTLENTARRELAEETGFREDIRLLQSFPIQIDRHTIPSNPSKGEPEHDHWDLRFPFSCDGGAVSLQHEEVSAASWRPITSLPVGLARRIQEILSDGQRG